MYTFDNRLADTFSDQERARLVDEAHAVTSTVFNEVGKEEVEEHLFAHSQKGQQILTARSQGVLLGFSSFVRSPYSDGVAIFRVGTAVHIASQKRGIYAKFLEGSIDSEVTALVLNTRNPTVYRAIHLSDLFSRVYPRAGEVVPSEVCGLAQFCLDFLKKEGAPSSEFSRCAPLVLRNRYPHILYREDQISEDEGVNNFMAQQLGPYDAMTVVAFR